MTKAWLLVTDVDDTLLGDDEALRRFMDCTERVADFGFVLNSSRPIASVRRTLADLSVPVVPLATIGALGTEIAIGEHVSEEWSGQLGFWDRGPVDEILVGLGAMPHDAEFQTPFKASFRVEPELREAALESLGALDQESQVIISGETDFDVIPPGAGKGVAAEYCALQLAVAGGCTIAAGDSGNDIALFNAMQWGIVVGNAREELRMAVDPDRTFLATKPYADGILEGLQFWGLELHTE